jgi:isoleucyl-tRNA synthetase
MSDNNPYSPVNPDTQLAKQEESVLDFWDAERIFEKTLELTRDGRPYTFYDGPPFATGLPHYGHILASVIKDIVPRYWTMRGFHVPRRFGWDCHGLPVEYEINKRLQVDNRKQILAMGIDQYNAECRSIVKRYTEEWKTTIRRVGRWVDMDRPYYTMDRSFMQSVWWAFKQLWDKGLVYEGYKVVPYSIGISTPLSNFEANLNYKDVQDPAITVAFAASGEPNLFFLAWTTTPWTLVSNLALAVHRDVDYVKVRDKASGRTYVLADALRKNYFPEDKVEILGRFKGAELVGRRYQPLFPFFADRAAEGAFQIIHGDHVTTDAGTGIVHIAPAFGEEDFAACRAAGLPIVNPVDDDGVFTAEVPDWAGLKVKDADKHIIERLKADGKLFRHDTITHSYPFCWRSNTPLIYRAVTSWFVKVEAIRDQLLAANAETEWVPLHLRDGRFGNWLENNVDWAVSRERYWGTPLPIWTCAGCGKVEVLGSVAELSERAGRDMAGLDLHRPDADEPTWACAQCGGAMRRVPDVADCWFDAGAMPVAQWHYPFENQEQFALAPQADFVSEGMDQTRGWFYTSHALATLLFDRPAFKNAIALGILAGADGRRMSKSRGTAAEPLELLDQYGADAVRWYMFASAPPYNSRVFLPEHVGDLQRQFMLTLWNTYSFFVTYANFDGWTPAQGMGVGGWGLGHNPQPLSPNSHPPIDRWALARLNALVRDVTAALDDYDIYAPAKAIESFVDELSNWYVRRNRRRFWKAESDADKQAAYQTLYTCLTTLSRLLAPFVPFLAEALWQNLVTGQREGVPESVHLAAWPQPDLSLIDERLLEDTALLLEAISLGRAARRSAALKVRQPLATLLLRVPAGTSAGIQRFEAELRDELNVKTVQYLDATTELVEHRFKPNLRVVGKQYGKLVPALSAALKGLAGAEARAAAQAVEGGQPFSLEVAGQTLELAPEAVLVESTAPEGYAVAEKGGVLVALDTQITEELRAEGLARELVRHIQDARKAAGLAIADRVVVSVAGADVELAGVLERWGATIRSETLAEALVAGAPAAGAYVELFDLDGRPLTLGVRKAG